jgi:segregation and condensation protein A
LEYKRYKSVIAELQVLETGRLAREGRGGVASELQQIAVKALVDSELESFTLFKLLKIYENLINRYEEKKSRQIHQVIKYEYTIQEQQTYLLETLKRDEALDFETIYGNLDNRIHAIVTFLAMLELLNMEQIVIIQGDGINQFWLKLVSLSR